MNTRLTMAAGLAGAVIALAGCGAQEPIEPVEIEAPDVSDCDAEDRRKNEIPDCGRLVNGRFVPWSWVTAGRTVPPPDWSPATEPSPSASPTRPRATATAAAAVPFKKATRPSTPSRTRR